MSGTDVLMIGNFDGVHRGHAALLARAREVAGSGRVVALVFYPHPVTTLAPHRTKDPLTTFGQRAALLRELGADDVERIEPTRALLGLSPEAFIESIVKKWNPGVIVEGGDFRFGRDRAGDVQTLRRLGESLGFAVDVVPEVGVAMADQTIVRASSTMVRWLVERGRVADAARLLGRPYELSGVVVQGDQRGRTIGFPTANVEADCLTPADGVYAAVVELPDGERAPAAVHVGPRATFDCPRRTVEAHIIGWDGPLDDYGWTLTVRFVSWLRGQARFDSVDGLVDQIQRDVDRAAEVLRGASASVEEAVA